MNTIHGEAKREGESREYVVWKNMKRKWNVCDDWMDFSQFKKDVGSCPTGHTIGLIHPYESFGPGNWKWVKKYTHRKGKVHEGKSVKEWAKELKIYDSTIRYHLRNKKSFQETIEYLKRKHAKTT